MDWRLGLGPVGGMHAETSTAGAAERDPGLLVQWQEVNLNYCKAAFQPRH